MVWTVNLNSDLELHLSGDANIWNAYRAWWSRRKGSRLQLGCVEGQPDQQLHPFFPMLRFPFLGQARCHGTPSSTQLYTQTYQYHHQQTTTTTDTTMLWPFVWDYPGEPAPEETLTYWYLTWLSPILYQLPPSTMIHGILPVQFTCLTIFLHNPPPSPSGPPPGLAPPPHTPNIPSPNHCLSSTTCIYTQTYQYHHQQTITTTIVSVIQFHLRVRLTPITQSYMHQRLFVYWAHRVWILEHSLCLWNGCGEAFQTNHTEYYHMQEIIPWKRCLHWQISSHTSQWKTNKKSYVA